MPHVSSDCVLLRQKKEFELAGLNVKSHCLHNSKDQNSQPIRVLGECGKRECEMKPQTDGPGLFVVT